ncbi:MAG: preprotein translocase subunit SecY [Oligoflexia bacterium]|nr:preprotein translocase subunit SecY [Oligoflexia bacterium]
MAIEGLAKIPELRRRLLFVLAMIAVFRFGSHVPTPGINGAALDSFFQAQNNGILGIFNLFSGGALQRLSIFALGIMPYISSSIIFQLLTAVFPYLEALNKEGEQGRKKIQQYTRYGTVVLCIIQGLGIATYLENSTAPSGQPLILGTFVGGIPFKVMTVITLTAGSCFIMWLGEQMTEKGIGNGTSLLIAAGIIAGLPGGFLNSIELMKSGEMSPIIGLGILALMIAVVAIIIFLEVGQRRIPVQYSQRISGRKVMGGQSTHLPLKINFAGVIPPIFASSLLMFPATLAQFIKAPWMNSIQDAIQPTGVLYNVLYVALIVFFCFFYTAIVFKPDDMAENLKKYGGFIPGIRAGKSTADYVEGVLSRITVGGAIYLSAVCVLPGLLIAQAKVPFYFGGTSLLILVGVALDTVQQIQSHLITHQYEGFMRGAKIRGRRASN